MTVHHSSCGKPSQSGWAVSLARSSEVALCGLLCGLVAWPAALWQVHHYPLLGSLGLLRLVGLWATLGAVLACLCELRRSWGRPPLLWFAELLACACELSRSYGRHLLLVVGTLLWLFLEVHFFEFIGVPGLLWLEIPRDLCIFCFCLRSDEAASTGQACK